MKICRYDDERIGLVQDHAVRDVTAVLEALGRFAYPLPRFDPFIAQLGSLKGKIEEAARRAKPIPVDQVRLLAPVANPGKIIAAPVNYTKHLQEALADKGIHHGNLVNEIHKAGMFLKATSAVVGPGEGVKLVHTDRRNDHEVELALMVGRTRRACARAGARLCLGLLHRPRHDDPRPRGASFASRSTPTACSGPGGHARRGGRPGRAQVWLTVNGERRAGRSTSDRILGVGD